MIDLVHAKGFFISGAPYNEDYDVLRTTSVAAVVSSQGGVQVLPKFALDQVLKGVFKEWRVLCVDVFYAV